MEHLSWVTQVRPMEAQEALQKGQIRRCDGRSRSERGRGEGREGRHFEDAPLLAMRVEEEAMSLEVELASSSWKRQGNTLSWSPGRDVAQPTP